MAEHKITLTDRQEDGLAYGIAQGSTLEGTAGAFCDAWAQQAEAQGKVIASDLAEKIRTGQALTAEERTLAQTSLDAAPVVVVEKPVVEGKT